MSICMDSPDYRLIVYGSLAPGGVNNLLFEGLEGDWERCRIRGRMGNYRGFRYYKYDSDGEEFSVWLFTSLGLPERFPDLDDFEGEEYQRIVIPARVGERTVMAHIYEGKYWD